MNWKLSSLVTQHFNALIIKYLQRWWVGDECNYAITSITHYLSKGYNARWWVMAKLKHGWFFSMGISHSLLLWPGVIHSLSPFWCQVREVLCQPYDSPLSSLDITLSLYRSLIQALIRAFINLQYELFKSLLCKYQASYWHVLVKNAYKSRILTSEMCDVCRKIKKIMVLIPNYRLNTNKRRKKNQRV